MTLTVGVDLGKTGCRAQAVAGDWRGEVVTGPGAPGLAEPQGVADALAAVIATVGRALTVRGPAAAEQRLGQPLGQPMGCVAIGAAGAEAAPEAARQLAVAVLGKLGAQQVAVASDSLMAHIGAMAGRTGVTLSVGTGAVALAVDAEGHTRRSDGWGPWLGDDGSGAWIGREGLRAVLLAREGRGTRTALTSRADQRFGDPSQLPSAVSNQGQVARTLATFAPDVLGCAADGDTVAMSVVHRAAVALAATTQAAAEAARVTDVVVVGGLAESEELMGAWRAALPQELTLRDADGTALDGALTLAGRTDLPHEAHVLRVDVAAIPEHTEKLTADGMTTANADGPPGAPWASGGDDDVDRLATERVRPDLFDLDVRGPEELVDLLLEAEADVPDVMAKAKPALSAAVRLASSAFAAGGRLIYVGAGTPGRLAAVDAAECPPTFGTAPGQVVAVLAGGEQAAVSAVEGAEDDSDAGSRDIAKLQPGPLDVVVGITASGRTPYVLGALECARGRGARTVAVVNNPASPARDRADVTVELLTGGEVLAGSTRMKAGTSQKIALNVLSTSAMIGSGKTYGAWMVDVMASNEKLRRRAMRILREATGVDDVEAVGVLDACGWHTKTALVAVLTGLDAEASRQQLADAGGRVRVAVGAADAGVPVVRPSA